MCGYKITKVREGKGEIVLTRVANNRSLSSLHRVRILVIMINQLDSTTAVAEVPRKEPYAQKGAVCPEKSHFYARYLVKMSGLDPS